MLAKISGGRGVVHIEPFPDKFGHVSGCTGSGSILISLGGITVVMPGGVAELLTSGGGRGSPGKRKEKSH